MAISLPPIVTPSPRSITVFWGWKSHPVSLNFLVMRTTLSTPGKDSNISSRVGGNGNPTTPTMVRSAPSMRWACRPSSSTRATTGSIVWRSTPVFMMMIMAGIPLLCLSDSAVGDRLGLGFDVLVNWLPQCDVSELLVGDSPFGAQLPGAFQIDMSNLARGLRGVDVDEHTHGFGERTGNRHFVRTDHRYLGPAEGSRRHGRKHRGEVGGSGKDGTGDVL